MVPNQLLLDGFWYGVKLVDVGECWAIRGASSAIKMISPSRTIPILALPLDHRVRKERARKRRGPGRRDSDAGLVITTFVPGSPVGGLVASRLMRGPYGVVRRRSEAEEAKKVVGCS